MLQLLGGVHRVIRQLGGVVVNLIKIGIRLHLLGLVWIGRIARRVILGVGTAWDIGLVTLFGTAGLRTTTGGGTVFHGTALKPTGTMRQRTWTSLQGCTDTSPTMRNSYRHVRHALIQRILTWRVDVLQVVVVQMRWQGP